jgi:hypothetical protein
LLARIFTVLYFAFFVLMPFYSPYGARRPPDRVVYHAH